MSDGVSGQSVLDELGAGQQTRGSSVSWLFYVQFSGRMSVGLSIAVFLLCSIGHFFVGG